MYPSIFSKNAIWLVFFPIFETTVQTRLNIYVTHDPCFLCPALVSLQWRYYVRFFLHKLLGIVKQKPVRV